MANLPFFIVDVFAEKKYAGNQLAVVLEAGTLLASEMQQLAKEMNYSETTFIISRKLVKGGFDVRIFTPDREIPFAGHPTLGTAFIIRQEVIGQPVNQVTLNLGVGQIPVTFREAEDGTTQLWMKQNTPDFGPHFDRKTAASLLGLPKEEIDEHFPVEQVSTGLPFMIIPLKTLEGLKRIHLNADAYTRLARDHEAKAILAFCPETNYRQNQLCARVFAGYYGVPEDPATGSANGCLAGYLIKNQYFGEKHIDIRVEQGYEIGRPSLLLLKAQEREKSVEVFVGGRVIEVARGELL
jgi:trans-2,3-dihydro-3-hydroxyanthranilate isomerase